MYIGDVGSRGLHHIFDELLDNSIDQFMAGTLTTVRVSISDGTLEFSDDGPGLPFNKTTSDGESLALKYLTELRLDSPTADGHAPHIHLGGWGIGLPVVTALTGYCHVNCMVENEHWQLVFVRGVPQGQPRRLPHARARGTSYRLKVDHELFESTWSPEQIKARLKLATYLIPGLRALFQDTEMIAKGGLADFAKELLPNSQSTDPIFSLQRSTRDFILQVAIAGRAHKKCDERSFVNGNQTIDGGSHLTTLRSLLLSLKLTPAVALIHVVMKQPRFSGPSLDQLDAPEIAPIIKELLLPSLSEFASRYYRHQ